MRLALWGEHLKDPIVALDKALKCVENSCQQVLARDFVEGAFSDGRCWLPSKPILEGVWPNLDPTEKCVFTHSIHGVECARKYDRLASSFSS